MGLKSFQQVASFCPEFGKHGGSAVFLKVGLQTREHKSIGELSVMGDFECSASECAINKVKLIILSIYKTPSGKIDLFFEKLEYMYCRENII